MTGASPDSANPGNRARSQNLWIDGTASAITTIVNEFTPFLAILIVVAHLVVIFWPRKPLPGLVDENGLPDIWRNQEEVRQNVTCIWRDKSAKSVVSETSPMIARTSEEHRSVA
jgi:hypothetical protein